MFVANVILVLSCHLLANKRSVDLSACTCISVIQFAMTIQMTMR